MYQVGVQAIFCRRCCYYSIILTDPMAGGPCLRGSLGLREHCLKVSCAFICAVRCRKQAREFLFYDPDPIFYAGQSVQLLCLPPGYLRYCARSRYGCCLGLILPAPNSSYFI